MKLRNMFIVMLAAGAMSLPAYGQVSPVGGMRDIPGLPGLAPGEEIPATPVTIDTRPRKCIGGHSGGCSVTFTAPPSAAYPQGGSVFFPASGVWDSVTGSLWNNLPGNLIGNCNVHCTGDFRHLTGQFNNLDFGSCRAKLIRHNQGYGGCNVIF